MLNNNSSLILVQNINIFRKKRRKKLYIDKKWHNEQIRKYEEVKPVFKNYADLIIKLLSIIAKKKSPHAIVQARPKATASFAEKAIRKADKYIDPVNQLTDLCGGRIISHTLADVDAICISIRENFRIDEPNSLDVKSRLNDSEFGYRSIHYVIQLERENVVKLLSVKNDKERDELLKTVDEIGEKKAEIQVRTVLSHAWADICHDRLYKTLFNIPQEWSREFARIAALLEKADDSFQRAIKGIDKFQLSYGAYMEADKVKDELGVLLSINNSGVEDFESIHKIARMAISIDDFKTAVDVSEKYKNSDEVEIVHDYALAKKLSGDFEIAKKYLEKVIKMEPKNTEAYCDLGDIIQNGENSKDNKHALEKFDKAYMLNHSEPRVLRSFLESKISADQNIKFISLLKPSIYEAIDNCKERSIAGVYLPHAFFDMGIFYALLGKPYESLNSFVNAILLNRGVKMIDSTLNSIESLSVKSELFSQEINNALIWGKILLLIAKIIKKQESQNDIDIRSIEGYSYLENIATKTENGNDVLNFDKEKLLLVLTGGFDNFEKKNLELIPNLLKPALLDYQDVMIAGGSSQGINKILGDINYKYDKKIEKIGYLSYYTTPDVSPNPEFKIRRTIKTQGSSAREFLQYWIDIIVSGIKPSKVKVIGLKGGMISEIENKMAIALNADVALIDKIFGTYSNTFSSTYWNKKKNYKLLPMDSMTIKAFIKMDSSLLKDGLIKENQLDNIAKRVHENYIKKRKNENRNYEEMNEWENLSEDFKNSNKNQILFSIETLNNAGYGIKEVKEKGNINFPEFTKEEIELMAEQEHGRWNIDRLANGWSYDSKKDINNKKSPYIVPYSELTEEIKDYDRDIARNFSKVLAEINLEIYKKN